MNLASLRPLSDLLKDNHLDSVSALENVQLFVASGRSR